MTNPDPVQPIWAESADIGAVENPDTGERCVLIALTPEGLPPVAARYNAAEARKIAADLLNYADWAEGNE